MSYQQHESWCPLANGRLRVGARCTCKTGIDAMATAFKDAMPLEPEPTPQPGGASAAEAKSVIADLKHFKASERARAAAIVLDEARRGEIGAEAAARIAVAIISTADEEFP